MPANSAARDHLKWKDAMKTKLAITSAALLVAGTLFAAAQGTQPGGQRAEDPPQGANSGNPAEGSINSPESMRNGTVGSGANSKMAPKTKSQMNPQPGSSSPSQPPVSKDSASPDPR